MADGSNRNPSSSVNQEAHIRLTQADIAHVEAYAEYRRIVGDDDGGALLSPAAYEKYLAEVAGPRSLRPALRVAWTNAEGLECRAVGPETACFCQHRFKQHATETAATMPRPSGEPIPIPCEVRKCPCNAFWFVPRATGGRLPRCSVCKHEGEDHTARAPFACRKGSPACRCPGYTTSHACECGSGAREHETAVQVAGSRAGSRARPGPPYRAMGALTGFSALAPGVARHHAAAAALHDSPITANDHPALRQFAAALEEAPGTEAGRQASVRRLAGESELDYYERQYQNRRGFTRQGK